MGYWITKWVFLFIRIITFNDEHVLVTVKIYFY